MMCLRIPHHSPLNFALFSVFVIDVKERLLNLNDVVNCCHPDPQLGMLKYLFFVPAFDSMLD